jgi:hypothetical protein
MKLFIAMTLQFAFETFLRSFFFFSITFRSQKGNEKCFQRFVRNSEMSLPHSPPVGKFIHFMSATQTPTAARNELQQVILCIESSWHFTKLKIPLRLSVTRAAELQST